ncbi:MAG TPA: hypothetical protein PKI19_08670 [Elusimicrobiales bacterium]|nr:hypothetical protein [Elusimicrobiales bacterium]
MPPELAQALAGGTGFLLRMLPVFAAGVYAAQLLEILGWLSPLGRLAGPVMRLGRLSPACGASFIASIVSPTAGHAMLADLRAEGRLQRSELTVAAVVNNLPGEIAVGKSVLPLAVPALGLYGAAYYGLLLSAAALKAALVLLAGRRLLPERQEGGATAAAPEQMSFRAAAGAAFKPALKVALKTSRTMIPVAYLIYYLIAAGVFDKAAGPLSFMTRCLPLNAAVLPVLAARLISPAGAYTIAGGLLASGAATGPELTFALFAGAFLATITSLRYTIPYYCGIFGGPDGAVIIGASLAARTAAYGAVLAALAGFIS